MRQDLQEIPPKLYFADFFLSRFNWFQIRLLLFAVVDSWGTPLEASKRTLLVCVGGRGVGVEPLPIFNLLKIFF